MSQSVRSCLIFPYSHIYIFPEWNSFLRKQSLQNFMPRRHDFEGHSALRIHAFGRGHDFHGNALITGNFFGPKRVMRGIENNDPVHTSSSTPCAVMRCEMRGSGVTRASTIGIAASSAFSAFLAMASVRAKIVASASPLEKIGRASSVERV